MQEIRLAAGEGASQSCRMAPGGMRVKLRPKGPILFRPPRACPAGEEVRIYPAGAQERRCFRSEMARGEAAWSFLAHHHACISTRLSFLNFCLRWGKPTGGQPSVNCGPFVMTFAFFGLSLTRMPRRACPAGADVWVRTRGERILEEARGEDNRQHLARIHV